jgi:hypothetical protein
MKLLETAHGYFETGSEIADAVIRCHREKSASFSIDSVVVPFRDRLGMLHSVRIMVGRPYTIESATVSSTLPELRDPEALARIIGGAGDGEFDDMRYVSAELDRLELPTELLPRDQHREASDG